MRSQRESDAKSIDNQHNPQSVAKVTKPKEKVVLQRRQKFLQKQTENARKQVLFFSKLRFKKPSVTLASINTVRISNQNKLFIQIMLFCIRAAIKVVYKLKVSTY